MKLEKGDRVIKARPYDSKKYCRYGGAEESVPIGTRGTITYIEHPHIEVNFDNGISWGVDSTELDKEYNLRRILGDLE